MLQLTDDEETKSTLTLNTTVTCSSFRTSQYQHHKFKRVLVTWCNSITTPPSTLHQWLWGVFTCGSHDNNLTNPSLRLRVCSALWRWGVWRIVEALLSVFNKSFHNCMCHVFPHMKYLNHFWENVWEAAAPPVSCSPGTEGQREQGVRLRGTP